MASQLAAIMVFIIMFALIITDRIERHIVTLMSGCATLIIVFGVCMHSFEAIEETLNLKSMTRIDFWYHTGEVAESDSGINWATIIFIAGMMLMVESMSHVGFFRWLCMTIAKLVRFKVIPVFFSFMIISAALSMFIDSITVILFLSAVTIELAGVLKFNPIPLILSEIFCANLGGSATMCGDPPNIIIGTSLGYSFSDFLTNTGIIAGISMVVIIFFFYFCFRKELNSGRKIQTDPKSYPNPRQMIRDKRGFAVNTIIFLLAVILLITHDKTGLTVAFIGAFVGLLSVIASGKAAPEILKKVDYKTLLFFIGLFIVVGGLEETQVLEAVAQFIGKISHGNMFLMVAIIIWISGCLSAFVDNIPFAATMIPVIRSLAATQGFDLDVLAWSLALGTDIGGSASPIGASANVVGTSIAAKNNYPISWGRYCRVMAPASIIVLAISTVGIWIRYL